MRYTALCAPAIVTMVFAANGHAETLIVNSYGGPYETIIRERIIEPFEARFGIKVIYDAVGSASAQFSAPHAIAVAVFGVEPGPDWFVDDWLNDEIAGRFQDILSMPHL